MTKLPKKIKKEDKNREKKARYIEYYAQLPIQKLAAAYIGVTDDTIINWKNNDSEFSEKIEAAKSQWALDKFNKVRSYEWKLERVLRESFSPRTEVTGNEGQPITFSIIRGSSEQKTIGNKEKDELP